jgi:aminoglycoside phosphotransferase family enzyme/predicted kinase
MHAMPLPDESPLPRTLRGLLRPQAYPHPVESLRVLETHMSWVILAGPFAYKIKRPVQFAFADFRDPQHRALLCAEEIRLNRRFAPDLYLDVTPVRLVEGAASFTGEGPQIEAAVRMRQFDRASELDSLVAAAGVTGDEFTTFGETLAVVHETLPSRDAQASWGDAATVAHTLRRNYAECLALAPPAGTSPALRALRAPLGALLARRRPLLAARAADGRVRECHGDLHLSNLVRLEGRITAFDALEFEPAFRWIDVADEVAFLCADLQGYRRPDLAAAFLSGYLDASGDFALLRVIGLYVAHRALVRAKIMAIRAATTADAAQQARWLERFVDYVAVARDSLAPPRPRLLLMHGLSGSGKTWLGRQLARKLPAVHLRSDLERKRLAGLAPLSDAGAAPGAGLYATEASERTYARLADGVRDALAGGLTVICDATFLERARRTRFREIADEFGAPTLLLDCVAPEAELRRRLRVRQAGRLDASDADEAVLDWQRRQAEPPQPAERIRTLRIDTGAADPVADALLELASARLGARS